MSESRPTANRTTQPATPAELRGLTVDDIPAHPRNVQRAYRSDEFNAERERADRAEAALEAERAEAASLRGTLQAIVAINPERERYPFGDRCVYCDGGAQVVPGSSHYIVRHAAICPYEIARNALSGGTG